MRFKPISLVLGISIAALASVASAQTPPTHKQALDIAAANKISDPQELWFAPDTGLAGVEGFGTDGKWYTVIFDGGGKIVHSGSEDGPKPKVTIAAAADSALKSGIAKLAGVWRRGGNWVISGWDAAEKRITVMIDGASGEVSKLGG